MALFERNKNIKADIIEEGLLNIEVSMMDNVHHISTTYHISFQDREIRYEEADFKKSPYLKVYRQTSKKMASIIGLKAYDDFAKKVTDYLGGKTDVFIWLISYWRWPNVLPSS
ncbi:MAG: DUF2889 domain-containing protein [Thermodesulfobacteriota bacterium]|nr:DUF2889 domain-containing protein [Thermodesulfobacteriota bacterium]